jgi:hypothetical protein
MDINTITREELFELEKILLTRAEEILTKSFEPHLTIVEEVELEV